MIISALRRHFGRRMVVADEAIVDAAQPGCGSDGERIHRLFDAPFYAAIYEDVVRADIDPFEHFMQYGWREGRDPSPHFNTLFYRDMHLAGSLENPLIHYIASGEARGLSTQPLEVDDFLAMQCALCRDLFSEVDYRRRAGYDGENALQHYLSIGWRESIAPSVLFEPEEYLSHHRFLSGHDISPLYHYASQRRACGVEPPLPFDLLIPPPEDALRHRLDVPLVALPPPKVIELAPMPDFIRQRLTPIWSGAHAGGRPVSSYRFENVYVTGEGLVFTADGCLIEITRSTHIDRYIREGALAVSAARATDCPTIEAGVLAENRGARNYGHFILEMLPRAWFARSQLDCRWPAIIQGHGSPIEHVSRQALRSIGYAPSEILSVGRDPVLVRELLFVDGLAEHPLYLSPFALRCYDEIAEGISAGTTAKVFASRGRGATRNFVDEPAVATALEAAGFSIIAAGDMSFEAQVALYRGAEHIVGVSGAALTNLLFCRPGTRVDVFSPTSASEVLFWLISALRGLRYREIRCEEVGLKRGHLPWDRDIAISPDEVLRQIAWSD